MGLRRILARLAALVAHPRLSGRRCLLLALLAATLTRCGSTNTCCKTNECKQKGTLSEYMCCSAGAWLGSHASGCTLDSGGCCNLPSSRCDPGHCQVGSETQCTRWPVFPICADLCYTSTGYVCCPSQASAPTCNVVPIDRNSPPVTLGICCLTGEAARRPARSPPRLDARLPSSAPLTRLAPGRIAPTRSADEDGYLQIASSSTLACCPRGVCRLAIAVGLFVG